VEDMTQKQRILQIFQALCVEMEGAAIAQVCYLNKIPFAAIRAISDKADGNAVEDFADTDKDDLVAAGIPPTTANKLIKGVNAAPAVAVSAAAPESGAAMAAAAPFNPFAGMATFNSFVNDDIEDEGSFLEMCRSGGVLKINKGTVRAALRALFGYKKGLDKLRKKTLELMELTAEDAEEQIDSALWLKIRKQLSRQSYAEVFEGLDDVDGSFVTDARKKRLYERLDKFVMPVLVQSFRALDSWVEIYNKQANNPMMMQSLMQMVMAMMSGAAGAMPMMPMMPIVPGIDTSMLRKIAEDLNDAINKAFAVDGTIVATAEAYNFMKLREIMKTPGLPQLCGVKNKDLLMKKLGVTASSIDIMIENNFVNYAQRFMNAPDITSDQEAAYFAGLWALGQATFPQLDEAITSRLTSIGGDDIAGARMPYPGYGNRD